MGLSPGSSVMENASQHCKSPLPTSGGPQPYIAEHCSNPPPKLGVPNLWEEMALPQTPLSWELCSNSEDRLSVDWVLGHPESPACQTW